MKNKIIHFFAQFQFLGVLEKKALVGLILVFSFFTLSIIIIGNKNLWFESKTTFLTTATSGDGLRRGTPVTFKGIRIGEVKSIDFNSDNQLKLSFAIKTSIASRIKSDSVALIKRSFIIGDKSIELTAGTISGSPLPPNSYVESKESIEILDLLSGSAISNFSAEASTLFTHFEKVTATLNELMKRVNPKEVADTYALIHPTLKNLHTISEELKPILFSVRKDLIETKLAIDTLKKGNKLITPLAEQPETINRLIKTVDQITTELSKNPEFTRQMVTALDEVVKTLKAIQKTWILKGHVEKN